MKTDIVLKPRLSEKAYGISQVSPVYVFQVPGSVSKQSVAAAVASQFDVVVESVNVLTVQGKRKRTYMNRRGKFVRGQRSNIKKAYITLQEGQTLPIFDAEEEKTAKQEKQAEQLQKLAEKAEKKAAKEKK